MPCSTRRRRRWGSWSGGIALAITALAALAGGTSASLPAAQVVTEGREVSGFDEVVLEGLGTLVITQGEDASLTLTGEPHVLPLIATEVRDHRLTIRPIGSFSTTQPITYALTLPDLHALDLSGATSAEIASLATDQLRLTASGSGVIAIDQLDAESLAVGLSGSAKAAVAGTVPTQTVALSGAAEYDAAGLSSQTAAVSAEGASEAAVQPAGELLVQVSGAATVGFVGNPRLAGHVSGAGKVVRLG